MKFKNIKVGEKYILKGKKEDWYFTGVNGLSQKSFMLGKFNEKDIVVAKKLHDELPKDQDVTVKGDDGEDLMIIDCKFLKKIKGERNEV